MSRSVGRIVGAVAFAAVGFFTGGAAWAIGAAVFGAAYGDYVARQINKVGDQGAEPAAHTVRSSKEPVRWILGRVSTGGLLAWAQEEAGDQDEGEWLHLVYMLSQGSIQGVDQIFLNKEPLSAYPGVVSHEVVINPNTVNQFLLFNCPDWRSTQIGYGTSFVRLSLKFDPDLFPSGIPDAQFITSGLTTIFDPRSYTYNFSENTALHILWVLLERCNVPLSEIVVESFIEAANICDESVENPNGTFSFRYRSGCVISDSEELPTVLDNLLAACAGKLIRVGGRWMLQVGVYYGPSEFTITRDMVIGSISGSVEVDNDSAINTITGTFIDPSQSWTETDFPPIVGETWRVEDGSELAESMRLRYVNNPYQAQRLASIRLRQRRSGGTISIPMNFAGYYCRPGRVVDVDLPELNISGEFIVADWSMTTEIGCSVQLIAYDSDIYDDAVGTAYDPIGFIGLPTGGMDAPTNVNFTLSSDPMIKQGTLTWSPPAQVVQYYGVIVRNTGGSAVQTYQVPSAATSCDIQGLGEGQYSIGVYARGELQRSGEASISVNLVAPSPPIELELSLSNNAITCTPIVENPGFGTEFEMCIDDLSNPEFIPFPMARGLTAVFPGLIPNRLYRVWARTVNPLGASIWFSDTRETTLNTDEQREVVEELLSESTIIGDIVDELTDRVDSRRQRIMDARRSIIEEVGETLALWEESETRRSQIVQVNQVADGLARTITELSVHFDDFEGYVTQQFEVIVDPDTGIIATAITEATAHLNDEIEAVSGLLNDVIIDPAGNSDALAALYAGVTGEQGTAQAVVKLQSLLTDGGMVARGYFGTQVQSDGSVRLTGMVTQDDGNLRVVEFAGDRIRFVRPDGTAAIVFAPELNQFVFDGYITANSITSEALTGKTITGGTFITNSTGATYARYQSSTPFGVTGDLINWYGQKVNGVTWNNSNNTPRPQGMSKLNARAYETSNGDVYFGGSFSAGTITISLQNTQVIPNPVIDTGSFGSNGGQILVSASLSFISSSGQIAGNCPTGSIVPYGIIYIERMIGSSWSIVAQLSEEGVYSCEEEDVEHIMQTRLGMSVTVTDNDMNTNSRRYRARASLENTSPIGPVQLTTQSLSIVCTEA